MVAIDPATIAEAYFTHVRTRNSERLVALFAQDAVFVRPDGAEHVGAAAIGAMYAQLFAAAVPSPTPVAMIAGERSVAVEITVALPDASARRTANFFYLGDDGLISKVSAYARA